MDWRFGKEYQLPQPGGDDLSEAAKLGFLSSRQGVGFSDQMGQTGLAVDPFPVQAVTVADQNAVPILDQVFEGLLGAVRVDTIKCHPFVDHGPQPVQIVFLKPGGFVDVYFSRS